MSVRVAVISDLHGNEVALDATLGALSRRGYDLLLCLGDVATLGPRPGAVLARLRDERCPCVMGNHDDFLLRPGLIDGYTEAPVIRQAVDWCREQLGRDDLEQLRGFAPTIDVDLGSGARLLACHGTPGSHTEDLLATTPAAEVSRMLGATRAQLVLCGHTHVQMLRQHRGTLIVNPGSVGMPFAEHVGGGPPTVLPHAECAIVEAAGDGITVSLLRVSLDRASLVAQLDGSACPLAPALRAAWA